MILSILFFLILLSYSIFSYSLLDPNLVLTSNQSYWAFQNFMWQKFYSNGMLMAYVYFGLIAGLFILYFHILEKLQSNKIELKNIIKSKYLYFFILIIAPLFFSYNSLSHDIFNYVFNAKIVSYYNQDPHLVSALSFPDDLWLRFMHNTHTTAPYGKGWTYLSLIPFYFGFGKFTLTLLSFRIWSLLGLFALYFSLQHLMKSIHGRFLYLYELGIVFLNPLFLIETISNYHNDLWMMSLAILGMSLIILPIKKQFIEIKKYQYFLISILFLTLSIYIKLSTIALIPIWIIIIGFSIYLSKKSISLVSIFNNKLSIVNFFKEKFINVFLQNIISYIPDIAGFLMFLPLFTARSQQFLPWYMIWVLVWTPMMRSKLLRNLIIVFTISSSMRYLPWLANNLEFNNQVIFNQKLITWIIPFIYLFTNLRKISLRSKQTL